MSQPANNAVSSDAANNNNNLNGNNGGLNDRFVLEKIQSLIREYNHLLTSQLEEQRTYFEAKLDHQQQTIMKRPEFASIAHTIEALDGQKTEKMALLAKLKREEVDILKKAEQVKKRAKISQEELAVATEINKNLEYSLN